MPRNPAREGPPGEGARFFRWLPADFYVSTAALLLLLIVGANVIPANHFRVLFGEDRFVENLSVGFFLLGGFVAAALVFRRGLPRRLRTWAAMIALLGFLCAGDELSWGERLLEYEALVVADHDFDAFHDVIVFAHKQLGRTGTLALLGALGSAALLTLYLARRTRPGAALLGALREHASVRLMILAVVLGVVASALDADLFPPFYAAHALEEVLEMFAGLAVAFAALELRRQVADRRRPAQAGMTGASDPPAPWRGGWLTPDFLFAASTVCLLVGLGIVMLPDQREMFYRQDLLVENLTVGFLLLCGCIAATAACGRRLPATHRLCCGVVAVVALLAGAEEMAWGQNWLVYQTAPAGITQVAFPQLPADSEFVLPLRAVLLAGVTLALLLVYLIRYTSLGTCLLNAARGSSAVRLVLAAAGLAVVPALMEAQPLLSCFKGSIYVEEVMELLAAMAMVFASIELRTQAHRLALVGRLVDLRELHGPLLGRMPRVAEASA